MLAGAGEAVNGLADATTAGVAFVFGFPIAEVAVHGFDLSLWPVTVRPPADGIVVRTTTDRRAWSELLERCIAEQIADPGMLRRQAQLNASAGQVLTVASIRGEDVGVGALGISGDTAILYSAGVLPAFRRRGVHGALITARLGLAHGRGAMSALLKTAPDSPAERSALSLGFTRTAVRRRVRRAG